MAELRVRPVVVAEVGAQRSFLGQVGSQLVPAAPQLVAGVRVESSIAGTTWVSVSTMR